MDIKKLFEQEEEQEAEKPPSLRPRPARPWRVAVIANVKGETKLPFDAPADAGAEFDKKETIQAIQTAIESEGHSTRFLSADYSLLDTLRKYRPDICFNIAEGIMGDSRESQVPAILEMLRIPYTASLSLAHADDTLRKLRQALDMKGFRFLHVLSPCPTGWKSEPALGMELVRLAVRSGIYPVIEVFDGKRYLVSIEPDFSDEALDMYLSLQRRFQRSGLKAAELRPAIDRHWQNLRVLSGRIVPARRDGQGQ